MRTEQQQKRYDYKKAWAKANAEKVRASRKKYEETHKEKVAEYRNSEKFKKRAVERATIYNKQNPDKRKETALKYIKNNSYFFSSNAKNASCALQIERPASAHCFR